MSQFDEFLNRFKDPEDPLFWEAGGAQNAASAPLVGPPGAQCGARGALARTTDPPEEGAGAGGESELIVPKSGHVAEPHYGRTWPDGNGQPQHGPAQPSPARPALDPKQRKICALLSMGLTRRQAAKYVGCHHATIARWTRRDPRFAEAVREAEFERELGPLSQVAMAGHRSWRAAAWLLERTQPAKYGRRAGRVVCKLKVRRALEELLQKAKDLWPDDADRHDELRSHVAQAAGKLLSRKSDPTPKGDVEKVQENGKSDDLHSPFE